MDQWMVVLVIIALVGLIATIAKPIISLTRSITALDGSVINLKASIDKNHDENKAEHDEIWDKEDQQDKQINSHEVRITVLERKN